MSIGLDILETRDHLRAIYCTHVQNDNISRVFSLCSKFLFSRLLVEKKCKKNGPKWQKILSVALHISGTIYHVSVINGTHV